MINLRLIMPVFFLVVLYTYLTRLTFWIVKEGHNSSMFEKTCFLIIFYFVLYFIFPPFAWYHVNLFKLKESYFKGSISKFLVSGIICFFIFFCWFTLSEFIHFYNGYQILGIIILHIALFIIPIALLFSFVRYLCCKK